MRYLAQFKKVPKLHTFPVIYQVVSLGHVGVDFSHRGDSGFHHRGQAIRPHSNLALLVSTDTKLIPVPTQVQTNLPALSPPLAPPFL